MPGSRSHSEHAILAEIDRRTDVLYHVTGRRETRTALLLYLAAEHADPLVLKAGKDWDRTRVEVVVEGHRMWQEVLRDMGDVFTPSVKPLPSHGAVYMPRIDGVDLKFLARRRDDTEAQLRTCGSALAAFHGRWASTEQERAIADVASLARRYQLRRDHTSRLVEAADAVLSAGDFAPWNVRVTPSSKLAVLDAAEAGTRIVSWHRDVAWFLSAYRWFDGMHESSFLDGYLTRRRIALSRADMSLLNLYDLNDAATRVLAKLRTRELAKSMRLVAGSAVRAYLRREKV